MDNCTSKHPEDNENKDITRGLLDKHSRKAISAMGPGMLSPPLTEYNPLDYENYDINRGFLDKHSRRAISAMGLSSMPLLISDKPVREVLKFQPPQ